MKAEPFNEAGANDQKPTVSHSYAIDQDAKLLFQGWLPKKWLKREQNPDFHVDFNVEIVNDGEPSGLHFLAQLKGRSLHKRKSRKLAEPFETKHLLYYLRCVEPVFVFLIDPEVKKGYWLFIQRYLKERVRGNKLNVQDGLTVEFDAQRSFSNQSLFEKDLRVAWRYMRDLHPGSPMAAILAEKKRLEKLDPQASVKIAASDKGMTVIVNPLNPAGPLSQLKFIKQPGTDELKAFFERGHELKVRASDSVADGSPILSSLLQELGDAKITIQNGASFKGCLQVSFTSQVQSSVIQIDGEWLLAPKRVSFRGELSQSPLRIDYTRETNDDGSLKPTEVFFRFNLDGWKEQPLLSLAYFNQINQFIQCDAFSVNCFIRGNQIWKTETFRQTAENKKGGLPAIAWLQKCRVVAQHIGVNPQFPLGRAMDQIQSDEVRLLVKLIESGAHEQVNSGHKSSISGEGPSDGESFPHRVARIELPEIHRMFDFFGIRVPFGPLKHIWTNVRVTSVAQLVGNRSEFTFEGEADSIYRVEYLQQGVQSR